MKSKSPVLGVTNTTIHIHTNLGTTQDWNKPVGITGLTLDGTFVGLTIPVGDKLTLTSVGVRLSATKVSTEGSGLVFSVGAFGALHLTVPGSITPLDLSYTISESTEGFELEAELGSEWDDVLGVIGFKVFKPQTCCL